MNEKIRDLKLFKIVSICMVLCLVLAPIQVFATTIEDKLTSAFSYYLDDMLFIQLRNYEESLGNTVTWDSKNQEIVVLKNDKWLYKAKLNGNAVTTPTATYSLIAPLSTINGRTYIEQSVLDAIHGNPTMLIYQFETGDCGFEPMFSDYHDDSNNYESYEMKTEHKNNPVIGDESKSLYIASQNRSDDMFMGYVKNISGLKPNTEYSFVISFDLATNVESGLFGIGGSPGEAVAIKCGIVNIKPEIEEDSGGVYRLNINHGSQLSEGRDMQVLGNMAKPEDSTVDGFEFKQFNASIKAVSDDKGSVYLIIASDSGFEGLTEYYLDNIIISYKN